MALSCGCEIIGGMPVTEEMLKAHYKHTFECLLWWEMIRKLGEVQSFDMSLARIKLLEAIEAAHPVLKED